MKFSVSFSSCYTKKSPFSEQEVSIKKWRMDIISPEDAPSRLFSKLRSFLEWRRILFEHRLQNKNFDQAFCCPRDLASFYRHHGDQFDCRPETSRTLKHYHIEGFKESP